MMSYFFYCKDLQPSKSKLYSDLNRDVFDKEFCVKVARDIHAMAILQFTTQQCNSHWLNYIRCMMCRALYFVICIDETLHLFMLFVCQWHFFPWLSKHIHRPIHSFSSSVSIVSCILSLYRQYFVSTSFSMCFILYEYGP